MGSENILGPRSVLIVSAIIMSKKPPTNGLKSPTCTLYTPRTLYHFDNYTIEFITSILRSYLYHKLYCDVILLPISHLLTH